MNAPAKQQRSTKTRETILVAAERLFGAGGVEPTPVTAVADEAGRAVGSLYHHFTDKSGLVDAVVERILDDLEADIDRALEPSQWSGRSILDIVAAFVTVSLERDQQRPGSKRILTEVTLTDTAARQRYNVARRSLQRGLVGLFLDRRHTIGHRDPAIAVPFVVDQLNAMLSARLDRMYTPSQLQDTTDERFAIEAVDSVRAYLRIDDLGGST